MARAQFLSTSQSVSVFSHIYHSSPQEANSHESASLKTSSTSPNITSPLSPPSLMETSASIDSIDAQSISPFTSDLNGVDLPDADPNAAQTPDVDPQILEALKSKDRIYVLKLGEVFEALIKERKARADLSPATSYQRLLVHRCSAYYKLVPENDPITKGIFVLYTADSRIPERRISELVPAESTTQPAFKIMRRATERRSKPQSQSQTGSIAGEDADLSDLEPSESGSQGGRSNATGGSSKKRMTIEEREAAYNKARSRIFNKFEEQGKDKDMSASSSSLSASTSNSTGTDEPNTPATAESDWSATSGPRDKKGRGNSGNSAAPHSRSIRSGASFNSSGSSRNSRAPSPSFTYATLYEPPPSGPMYDPQQHPHHQSAGYYPNQSMYSFPSCGQGPSPPPFTPVYPFYTPYGAYQPPPHHQYNLSDPPAPSSESFPPPHQMNYGNYYGWSHHPNQPPIQSPPHAMHHPLPSPQYPNHLNGPPPPQTPPFQTFMPQSQPVPYPYPVNGQFAPSSGPYFPLPPHMNPQQQQQQQPPYENPRSMNSSTMGPQPDFHLNHGGNGLRNGLGNGVIPPNSNGRVPVARGVGPSVVSNGNGVNGTKSRPPMPPQARTAWSYGPGVGMGGYVAPNGITAGDAIGPRLSSNHRRTGNSNSSNGHASSNFDEVSSTASSSTASSSSRRTYTSTTSSQHPLPARPDWAVGLKAQPTLAGRLHEQHSLTNSRTISTVLPPWSNGNLPSLHNNLTPPASQEETPPTSFQSTDFPPLTSAQEKRAPVVTGAWGLCRPSLPPTNGNGSVNGSVNGGTALNSPISRLDEADGVGPERPVGKVGELYNPTRQPPINGNGGGHNGQSHQRMPSDRITDVMSVKNGEVVANANNVNACLSHRTNASLVVAVSTMSLGENGVEPSSSISTFLAGIEQEPTVAATSST